MGSQMCISIFFSGLVECHYYLNILIRAALNMNSVFSGKQACASPVYIVLLLLFLIIVSKLFLTASDYRLLSCIFSHPGLGHGVA